MTGRLSWQDICSTHPDRWVFLLEPEFDETNEILSAIVQIADGELSEVATQAKELKAMPHAFRYTGRIHPQVGLSKWNVNERI